MNSNSTSLNRLFNPSGWLLFGFLSFVLIIIILTFVSTAQIWPFLFATLASGSLGYLVVPILQRIKASQIIQEDGPQSHLKKAGTPTMGGIFFIPTAVIVGLILMLVSYSWYKYRDNIKLAVIADINFFALSA